MNQTISRLVRAIDLEEQEQANRYRLDPSHSLKALKAEGLAIHPIKVIRKSFGYAEYPEISFKVNYPIETNLFKDGAAIECFLPGEDPIKGILMTLDGKQGEFRLFAPDYPDWIDENGVGIKLAPDTRTTTIMKKVLIDLENNKRMYPLFERFHGKFDFTPSAIYKKPISFTHPHLNSSQQDAVQAITYNQDVTILHGPPGTGKTTTLIEGILQLIKQGEKLIVTAPSNTAVDHISRGLILSGVQLLRIGNITKVDQTVFAHTSEGKMKDSPELKNIKELKKRIEEFRKMANKYHRKYGKDEKEQRNLLLQEIKNIRHEIKSLQDYFESKLYDEAQVIAGTPIGLWDAKLPHHTYQTLIMDEAGQCIEPLAWCVFPLADKYILAGDHYQLPPTVLSYEAMQQGLNQSILEVAIRSRPPIHLLDTQYRMRPSIAGYSSQYFYESLLKTASHLIDDGVHITFVDTAGAGMNETHGSDGISLQNTGELDIAKQLIELYSLDYKQTAFISPYAGQVVSAKEILPSSMRISTVDSFQGQEMQNLIVSLVRSNEVGEIGFLKDYRRMNVAITRAKEKLFVIGDSATIGHDDFYSGYLDYVEKHGEYKSAWEFLG